MQICHQIILSVYDSLRSSMDEPPSSSHSPPTEHTYTYTYTYTRAHLNLTIFQSDAKKPTKKKSIRDYIVFRSKTKLTRLKELERCSETRVSADNLTG